MARHTVAVMKTDSPLTRSLCWGILLIGLATGWRPAYSQDQPSGGSSPGEELTIVIVEGEGGINNIKKGIATKPVVEVHDRNKNPLAGVLVTFTLPGTGPSGTFVNGAQLIQVTTDASGRASAVLHPNDVSGNFNITVHASYHGHTATASISQTNSLAGAAGASSAAGIAAAHSHLLLTIAVVAGAAVAGSLGAYYGSKGGATKAPSGSIGAPGTVTLGPPQ